MYVVDANIDRRVDVTIDPTIDRVRTEPTTRLMWSDRLSVSVGCMWTRTTSSLRTLGWICAAALAAVVASERIYWYWAGIDADSLSVLTVFYAVAVAAAVAALARSSGTGARRAVFGGAVFALVVEGIITPVMYEDGPLPVLYLMFVGWHGLLAFVGFVYLVRRWALDGRSTRIAVGASVAGVGWGAWALASGVTDRETAQEIAAAGAGSADVLLPAEFATYSVWTGLVLIFAHVVMDRLWPARGWSPSRTWNVATAIAVVALASLLVIPVVPWAPLKLVGFGWLLWRFLGRSTEGPSSDTLIDELAGRVRYRNLAALLLLPLAATLTYWSMWAMRDDSLMEILYLRSIDVQVAAGIAGLGWAIRRRSRTTVAARPTPPTPSVRTTVPSQELDSPINAQEGPPS